MNIWESTFGQSHPSIRVTSVLLSAVPGAPRYYNKPGHPAHGAWIPGTTLPQGFIEGRPWERQWAAE